ncbi:AAA family ATPase [Candidatus Megaera polyxenophila]|uniref:AAA family ATPase n=1 Tax=Candidatus Megaera polyxenophila TaxID=988779 RepID=UPI00249EA8FA|nr:AAA family ATPase [Candidatus Megaera polyxenophila]
MLQNLSIQDFLLIEKLDLDFEDGFCVLTGQTGAGKSILLDAILFALGSKASGEVVRANQEKAVVVLTFARVEQAAEYLSEYDINLDPDDDIIIKRIQYANGRRKFLLNDNLVTQRLASDLFDYLLEIHGQHNHTLLRTHCWFHSLKTGGFLFSSIRFWNCSFCIGIFDDFIIKLLNFWQFGQYSPFSFIRTLFNPCLAVIHKNAAG